MKIPEDMVEGTEFYTNNFGTLKILKYTNASTVKVQFIVTGATTMATSDRVRKGIVKDYYHPSVEGVGYSGKGHYNFTKDNKAYYTWLRMFARCYSESYLSRNPSYRGCTVNKEWHCFQDFAPWFYTNYIEGYQLDKDIIGTGKEYSPSNCIFVTQEDNSMHATGTLGVSWVLTKVSTGEDFIVNNQSTFAREKGLSQPALSRLCRGERQVYQGYRLKS